MKHIQIDRGLLIYSILFVYLIFPNLAISNDIPQWLQAYHDGLLTLKDSYYGVGVAKQKSSDIDSEVETHRLSKDRALDELCYQLSVSIKSELQEDLIQKGKYADQNVASSLFVSTRNAFSGIKEKYIWHDLRNHQYWVMLSIDKQEADKQVKQQSFIKEVVDRLENKQDEIINGIAGITAIFNKQMKRNEERMTQYNKILESIDQTKTTSSSETRDEYKQFNKDIKKIESQWKQQNSMMKNHDKFFEEIIKQNNATQELIKNISKNINQDHFLTLAQDDVKNKNNNPDFDIQITPQRGHAAKYYSKESVKFKVKANRDCYIKVIYISSIKGKTNKETKMNVLLFPNNHDRNNRIKAGKETTIGKFGELEIQPPFGKDIVTVVASENQFTDIDEMLNSTSGKYYAEKTTNVRSLVKHRARGIRVSENFALGEHIVSGYGTDTCFIITQEK